MANMIQAAKWMQEGRIVLCHMGFCHRANPDTGMIEILNSADPLGWEPAHIYVNDALLGEWEIAEEPTQC